MAPLDICFEVAPAFAVCRMPYALPYAIWPLLYALCFRRARGYALRWPLPYALPYALCFALCLMAPALCLMLQEGPALFFEVAPAVCFALCLMAPALCLMLQEEAGHVSVSAAAEMRQPSKHATEALNTNV